MVEEIKRQAEKNDIPIMTDDGIEYLTNYIKENNINTIYELCKFSRMELSSIGLTNSQITDVAIALQLLGLDLKKNHAKKNLIVDGKKK